MGTQITDLVDPKLKKLISMCMESTLSYKIILKRLERDARVNLLFHNDLSHIQQYLFSALKIEPTSKVEVVLLPNRGQ